MTSALPFAYLRRTVASFHGNTSSYALAPPQRLRNQFDHQNVPRWIGGGGGGGSTRGSSTTNKQRGGAPRRKKPIIITTTAPSPTTTTNTNNSIVSPTSTSNYANIRMAPHMMQSSSTSASNNKTGGAGILDYMKNNPLLFAVVVFPTATMGLLLLVKPNLRPKFMSGGGGGSGNVDGSAGGSGGGVGSSSYIPNEAPVYDNATNIEEEKTEQIRARDVALMTKTIDDADASSGAPSPLSHRGRGGYDMIDSNNGADDNDATAWVTKGEESQTSATIQEVIDLFSAIGIRPHPGGGGTST